MNDQLESRLRTHLRTLDSAGVSDPESIGSAAHGALARRQRSRRTSVGVLSVLLVGAAGAGVWASRGDGATAGPTDTLPATTVVSDTATTDATTAPPITVVVPYLPDSIPDTVPDTTNGAWRDLPPDPRGASVDPTVVWTGTEAIVTGGYRVVDDGDYASGVPGASAYDPATNSWRTLADPPEFTERINVLAFWTGTQMVQIGGDNPDGSLLVSYTLVYDLASDSWDHAEVPNSFVSSRSPWVWTGSELLVMPADTANGPSNGMARAFDPATGRWRDLAPPPLLERQTAASVWTGTEWIVWGGVQVELFSQSGAVDGGTLFGDGAAYDPATDTWRTIAASPLSARIVDGVWTGSEMIVDAGRSAGTSPMAFADGAAYDPVTDTWRTIAPGPAHPGFESVFTGRHMLMFAKGGVMVYDVAEDRWVDTCCSSGGVTGTVVWTGREALTFGSGTNTSIGGSAFTPPD